MYPLRRSGYREGSHLPPQGSASSSPGQGGIVAITISSGASSSALNWKQAPVGIEQETPSESVRSSTVPSNCLHSVPEPPVQYHISSTVLWRTGFVTCPGRRVQWTMLPLDISVDSRRISEPSGAMTSGSAGSLRCSKFISEGRIASNETYGDASADESARS